MQTSDKEFLVREYVEGGKTVRQIAREQGCSHSTVLNYLNEHGVAVREYATPVQCRGQVPFGYRIVNGSLTPLAREQVVIRDMQAMRARGCSCGQIATWLNESGIETKNRKAHWDRPTVFYILARSVPEKTPITPSESSPSTET